MSVYKIFILLVFRECMERNVMTWLRILSSFECCLRYFQTKWLVFFTLQRELFTSCNVSNHASLVSARTGGEGVTNQMRTGLDRGRGVPEIPKFVRASFVDDPLDLFRYDGLQGDVHLSSFGPEITFFREFVPKIWNVLFKIKFGT